MPGLAILFARITTALGGLRLLSWWHRIVGYGLQFFLISEVISLFSTITNTIWGGTLLLWADNNPKIAEKAVKFLAKGVTNQTPIAVQLAAETISQITGIGIDKDKLAGASTADDRLAYKQVMGAEFTQVVDQMLDLAAAQQDFQSRTGWTGSAHNLNNYFGTNLDFQLRSLTIGTISSIFGWQSLRHLEGLHQSINWAFGFGWLSWSVLSNAMDVAVNAGLKRHYNALVKPHDLSQSQANKLRIRNVIDAEIWKQVHANAGMRDDARDWQLQLEFNQPSLSTIHAAYDHKLATEAQVDEQMLLHELTPQGAEWEKKKITEGEKWKQADAVQARKLRHLQAGWESQADVRTRLTQLGMHDNAIPLALEAHASERVYHLRDAVTKEHLKFLRHGWETEQDTRNWLQSQNWTEEEIQLALEANRLEQKAGRQPVSHKLNPSQLKLAMKFQLMTADDVYAYLLEQGYDAVDALIIVIEDEIGNLPNLKDCGDPFSPSQLLALLAGIIQASGTGKVPPSLLKWAQCAITKI